MTYTVEDELVLYAPERGQAVSLNRSAGAVWNLCDGDKSVLEISKLLAEWSGCPVSEVFADVRQAIANLLQNGLIELPNPNS